MIDPDEFQQGMKDIAHGYTVTFRWITVGLVLLFLALCVVFYAAYAILPSYLPSIKPTVPAQLFWTVAASCIAGVLFFVREHRRDVYATIELAFGLVSTWQAVGHAIENYNKWPLVAAAMYIVVRALDNFRIWLYPPT